MIQYQKLNGIQLSGAAPGPVIPITPEGQAMAGIPGWSMFFDPSFVVGNNIRNRARRDLFATGSDMPLGTEGGQPVFAPTDAVTMRHNVQGVGLNPVAWTVFTVARPSNSSSFQRVLGLQSTTSEPTGQTVARIGFSTAGASAQVSGGPGTRLSHGGGYASRTGLSLVMWTFSTRDGLRIFDNGGLAASNPNDKAPLTFEFGPGQLDSFRFCRGVFGMTGAFSIDLGWPEHSGYRRRIERFMRQKYNIASIPS